VNNFNIFSYREELARHGIKDLEIPLIDEVDLKLPKLKGNNIEEHFNFIAKEQAAPYQNLISSLIKSELPPLPKVT
jgi:DNA polymerase gamma 1